jgi:hypothetical protein
MLPHRQPLACATHRKSVREFADRQRLTSGSHAAYCVCVLRVCGKQRTQPTKDVRAASRQTLHAQTVPDRPGTAVVTAHLLQRRHPDILRSAASDRSPPVPRTSFTFWATDGADPGSAGSAGPTFAGPAWAGCFWIGALPRCMGAVNQNHPRGAKPSWRPASFARTAVPLDRTLPLPEKIGR